MNKLFILALISLSVVLACHPSCNCAANSNVCLSCKLPAIGSEIHLNKRSCPCPAGYYTSSLFPNFACSRL